MLTLKEAIAARGLTVPKPLTPAQYAAAFARRAVRRKYPPILSLSHQLLIEAQGPCVTYTDDGDFSSRGLTDWYVREYCKLNHLKRS